jgi:hypothetical protein
MLISYFPFKYARLAEASGKQKGGKLAIMPSTAQAEDSKPLGPQKKRRTLSDIQ